jgi:hypothetical protein
MKTTSFLTLVILLIIMISCGNQGNYDNHYHDDYYAAIMEEGDDYDPEDIEDMDYEAEGWEEYESRGVSFNEQDYERMPENGDYRKRDRSREANNSYQNGNRMAQSYQNQGGNDLTMIPSHDPKTGMVSGYYPLPASWRITPEKWTGPYNTEVLTRTSQGKQPTFQSIDQVIQQLYVSGLRNSGTKVGRIVDLPRIANNDARIYKKFWKYAPTQDHHAAKGIEITQASTGYKGFIVVHFIYSVSQFGSSSYQYSHVLTTTSNQYEKVKNQLIYALENSKTNPQWIAQHNRNEQMRASQSDMAFQQRMRSNQQYFDATQQQYNSGKSVGDILYDGYMNRSKMQDEGQSNLINGISEQQTMVDPYTGQNVQMDSGYKYYYMNQFGEYFGTNDEFYNPDGDQNLDMEYRRAYSRGGGY